MKRLFVTGLAVVSILGVAGVSSADQPPKPTPIREVGRFQQLSVPAGTKITGARADGDPETTVSVTIVLATDSVGAARARAERLNQRFDAAAAARQVAASQQTALPLIRAAGATVRTTTSVALNAVNARVKVKDLKALAAVPGVAQVHVARSLKLDNGASDTFTNVPAAWQDLGVTGDGMTIAIIDDGTDYYHADFGGSGDPDDYANDDGLSAGADFPTAKVVGGYDFVGDNYDADADQPGESDVPVPDDDPLACGHHGTHVAGTAAGMGVLADGSTFTGPYNADTISSNDFLVAPGAAPEALIYSFKVFGCDGSVNDDVILDAIEAAVVADVDVINMSLGSPWGTADEPIALAIDNATAQGIMSVISAGNEGPSAYMVGGPGTANTALSVAANDAANSTLPGALISFGTDSITAQNSNLYEFSGPITGELVDVGLGCEAADYTGTAGKIAVATRGTCDRIVRAQLGTDAGALAVIFVNNADAYPPVEGVIPDATIPFVGIPSSAGGDLPIGDQATVDSGPDFPNPTYGNFASFSSNGPRQDSFPKPDITAPGSSVLSAGAGTGDEGILLSGTSMASPHTAGIAVLVRQQHPTWSPRAVKGAMMSTADPSAIADWNVQRGGTGAVDAEAATKTVAYFSTADGRNNLAFGFRQLTGGYTATRSITITNTSASPITYNLSSAIDDLGTDLSVTINPASVTVPAGGSRNVAVTLSLSDPENLPDMDSANAGDLAAIKGLVIATPTTAGAGIYPLKTPLLLVAYGVSDIRAAGIGPNTRIDGQVKLVEQLKIANQGVHYGSYDTYQWAISDMIGDNVDSVVPDVRDVGVQAFPIGGGTQLVVFAISTRDRFTTHATNEYDVYIDVDGDDVPDGMIITADNGLLLSGAPDGVLTGFVVDMGFNILEAWTAYAPANGNIVEVPVSTDALEYLGAEGPMSFAVGGCTVLVSLPCDGTALGYFDYDNPAVQNADFDYLDAGQATLVPVGVDQAAAIEQGAYGWLVVSADDTAGIREADRVPLRARRVSRV